MKYTSRIIAAVLFLLLCLSGCNTQKDPDALRATYNDAKSRLEQAADITMTATYKLERTVSEQTYTESISASVSYSGRGSDAMNALVKETLKYGTYEAEYTEFYTGQTAYCQINTRTFSTSMTAGEFAERQLPVALLDASLYSQITSHKAGKTTVISFSEATAPEAWVTDSENVQLVSASATATVASNGNLVQTTYIADYIADGFPCHIETSVSPAVAENMDLSSLMPSTDGCTPISCYEAPKLLLQTVGNIFSATSVTASAQEALVCSATALTQNAQTNIDLFGSGDDFMARSEYSSTVSDYTGIPVTTTLTETFRDGVYSHATNGGDPVTQETGDGQSVRTDCEDTILSGLFTPEHIQDAILTDTGDFFYIQFTGNDTFVKELCSWIYTGIGIDLDNHASSVSTEDASGWLSIDKRTCLPTGIGQILKRNYIIENISHPLIYEYSQSLYLSSESAYKSITGTLQPEEKPETATTPLLYKVTGDNGQQLWLFGTIHIGDARTAYLPQALYDAFNSSDALAVETDMNAFEARLESDQALRQQLATLYYYPTGSDITEYLDSETYEAAKTMLQISGQYTPAANRMKVSLWENAISNFLLQQSYSLVVSKGVEQRLLSLAAEAGKPVRDIESPIAHALLTVNYSDALQVYLLKGTLELSVSEYREEIVNLYELWCQGDEAALAVALKEDTSSLTPEELLLYNEYYTALMTDRNAIMLERAKEYLKGEDTVFFAVGLAHIFGDDGLAASLRNAGYSVEPVSYVG